MRIYHPDHGYKFTANADDIKDGWVNAPYGEPEKKLPDIKPIVFDKVPSKAKTIKPGRPKKAK